jgi:hypothetical protein
VTDVGALGGGESVEQLERVLGVPLGGVDVTGTPSPGGWDDRERACAA